jgi:hypothetical protein
MTGPDNPNKTEELLESLRRSEAAVRRAGRGGMALRIVFFLTWLYILWSCRDGCSELSWFLVAVYPVLVVYYLIVRKRAIRRILSEIPGYQEALAEQQKKRDRHQSE